MSLIYKLIDWVKSKLKGKPKPTDIPYGDPGDHPPPPPPRK